MADSSLQQFIFLFVDIVKYSTLPDPEQLSVVEKMHKVVEAHSPGNELASPDKGTFLATGDGMIAAFRNERVLRHPHEVVNFALEIKRQLLPLQLRIGLHIGDAETYSDFNARHFYQNSGIRNNIAGTGINLAQRIMSLADPGDILASKQFFDHYQAKEARDGFDELGVVKVKHGKELGLYKFHPESTRLAVPKRIRDYHIAQTNALEILRLIHGKVEASVRRPIEKIKARVSLLAYDPTDNELHVTGFRYGSGIHPGSPPSRISFTLTEGPGQAFTRNSIFHYELPPPPPLTDEDVYLREFERLSKIPRDKIRLFQRWAHDYLYFPMHYGRERSQLPYGVLSIDTLYPLFPRSPIEKRIRRDKHVRDLNVRVEKEIGVEIDRLGTRLGELFQQFGAVWTIVNHY